MNIAVPSQPVSAHGPTAPVYTGYGATPYPVSMSHGGSWPLETPYDSRGYTSAGAPPPQLSSSSPDLFNPRLFTTQLALLVAVFRGLALMKFVVVEKCG